MTTQIFMSEFVKVGTKADFKDGTLTGVQVNGLAVCVAHAAGGFYAFADRCTHAEAMLSRGDLEDGEEVVCPLHGARFSIKTGAALTPPAVKPVKTFAVKVEGENVFVEI
jgi:3-phenylpropionate/trans-cinnamate dioxygenase ferredoxin subunit